jgi:hypothetical protein
MTARVFELFPKRPDPFSPAREIMDRVETGLNGLEETTRLINGVNVRILRDDAVSTMLRALGAAKGRAEMWALLTKDPEWRHTFTCAAADIEDAIKAADAALVQARAIEDRNIGGKK